MLIFLFRQLAGKISKDNFEIKVYNDDTISNRGAMCFPVGVYRNRHGQSAAQEMSAKERRKHEKTIAESREKQSVELSLDTIFNKGEAYCVLKRPGGILNNEYEVFPLNGDEVIYATMEREGQNEASYYKIMFLTMDGKKASYPAGLKGFYKELVENDLLRPNGLNEPMVHKFLRKYSENPSAQAAPAAPSPAAPVMTERNRNEMIFILGSSIKQDNTEIGKVEEKQELIDNHYKTVFYVYYANGGLCARATKTATGEAEIITAKDNRVHNLSDTFIDKKDIVEFLVENLYL